MVTLLQWIKTSNLNAADPPENAPEGQSVGDNQQRRNGRMPQNILQVAGICRSENASIPVNGPDIHAPENEPQYLKLHKQSNQQPMVHEQATNRPNRLKQVPFALLLPVILQQLDKDKGMQLQTLYAKLKKNEIAKDGFVRIMRGIVGDQMLKLAVTKLQQSGTHQPHTQGGVSALLNHPRMQSAPMAKFTEPHSLPQLHQKVNSEPSHSISSTVNGREVSTSAPTQGLSRQQHIPMYGSGGSYHQLGGINTSSSASSIKSRPGGISQTADELTMPKLERPNTSNDPKIMQISSHSHLTSNISQQQGPANWKSSFSKEPQSPGVGFLDSANAVSLHSESLSITSSEDSMPQGEPHLAATPGGNIVRTPSKKPSIGRKKPIESVSPPTSKKQKVSGALADQSIEQLIDVTAVSRVNLREEEEQLFSASKEDSRASEASRKFVQEEEETLILLEAPL
ncbi:hypothetical protein SAY87_011949 [Trapa incisa]|uniref:RST domain-containing protein n=1 Tax=Trapa incisa TaxID=236973 RepID=A0AAN7GSN0_9MYRT|nr:hypothetical protein SAY87_011949 [Trapa incisa]